MPLINLIEEHRLAIRRDQRRTRFALLSFVGAAVSSLGAVGFCLFESANVDSQIASLKQQTQKSGSMLAEIDKNEKALSELGPRMKTLSDAQEATMRWNRILEHLSKQTPPGSWLTSMRTTSTDPSKPIMTDFQGISARQELVGEFILRMQTCDDLGNVGLKFTQEKVAANGKGIEFDVTAEIAGTAEAKAKDEQKETKTK